jgi:hypothetical protein
MPLQTLSNQRTIKRNLLPKQIELRNRRKIEEVGGKRIDILRDGVKLRRKNEMSKEKKMQQNTLEQRRIMTIGRDGVRSRISQGLFENQPVMIDGQEGVQMVINGFLLIVVDGGEKLYWADNLRELTYGERDSIDNDERWSLEMDHFEDFYKKNKLLDDVMDEQQLRTQQFEIENDRLEKRRAAEAIIERKEAEIQKAEFKRLDQKDQLNFRYLQASPSVVGRSASTELLRSKRKKKKSKSKPIIEEDPYEEDYRLRMSKFL